MAAESKQENAIIVDHVKKHFKVFLDKGQSFKERRLFGRTAGGMRTVRCCGTFLSQ